MPSPDLPQPIYPHAPAAQPPAPPGFHGAPGGYPPQQQGPGGWNAAPQQQYPAPSGGGYGRRTQILLAAGAAVVVAAVVLVIVLTTRNSDSPTDTAGTGTQNTGGNGAQTVEQGGSTGGGQGSGPDKAEIVSALSLTLGAGFSAASYDCMADALVADPDLFDALNTSVTTADASAFSTIVVGCSSVDERVEAVATAMSLQNDPAVVECAVSVMYTWDESTWQWYFEGVLNPATQADTPTQAFGNDCGW